MNSRKMLGVAAMLMWLRINEEHGGTMKSYCAFLVWILKLIAGFVDAVLLLTVYAVTLVIVLPFVAAADLWRRIRNR